MITPPRPRPLRLSFALVSVFAGLAAAGSANAFGGVLVDDKHPGLGRARAPSASGAQWVLGAGLAADEGASALTVRAGSAPGSFLAHFTRAGQPATIAIGEIFSVSLVFSLSNLGTANGVMALRVGLFDSGSSRADDGFATQGETFKLYVGYVALLGTRANGAGITIRERIIGTNYFLNSTDNPPFTSPLPRATGASQAFAPGTSYTATLSATRTGIDSVDFRIAISGGSFRDYTLSYTDAAAPTLSFDTLGFGWARNLLADGGVVTVESLRVSLTGGEAPAGD